MKRILLYWLLSISMPVLGSPTLLVVGDSLSAGYGVAADRRWVTQLTDRLRTRCHSVEVINASVSGDTSSGGVTRLVPLLQRHKPDLVIVELGGNDGLRGINTRTMRDNLLRMVRLSQESGAGVLLLGVKLPANYGPDFVKAFHQVYFDVAEAASVPLLPFFLEGVALNSTLMQADGIHPNDEAQLILLENVWSLLETMPDDQLLGFRCLKHDLQINANSH
ncbi:MAG: arylesterase [Candidatus Thiodiazotropha sp. (ex Semelilucina semeliformis)]|nr:arylesterase [Candidatus Thiodiazotropha sp. (ex Myrtea spinifera)]MCU7808221.1 arylesterase [Candidatus Thiodiazotropha sp. (ex Semelilucina semeliformis)]